MNLPPLRGCATDAGRRYYKTVNGVTRHLKWNLGFWMVRRGNPYPFPLGTTDWDFWLKEVRLP
jgi:hypothetical protein